MPHVRAPAVAIVLFAVLACSRPASAQAADAPTQDEPPPDPAQTLDTLHVTAQRPPTAQAQFRNHLQRNWHPPRSAEQFGLDGGVPAWLGQQMLRGATAAARSLPGWKRQVEPPVARPPPLDDEQMDRAQAAQSASPAPAAQPR